MTGRAAASCTGMLQVSCRTDPSAGANSTAFVLQGPDLLNILRQSYDYLTIMQMLRSTYDGRLIYKTSYEERKVFLKYDSLAKS